MENQSSILHTIETNKITVNGVNVVVDKPKKGDVMCITRYTENGILLDADKQEVIWIDGLSIEPKQLSQKYEPVGICVSIRENKAMVRYKEERALLWWDSQSQVEKLPDDYPYYNNRGSFIYTNNGFNNNVGFCGCCRALFYDYLQTAEFFRTIDSPITKICDGVSKSEFESNVNCQILRDNFSSYNEYLESLLIKLSCGIGGVITEEPCGKDNTYKIANIAYNDPNYADDRAISDTQYAYPAANWAASINLNAPNLGEGNWWMPSVAEMAEMMRDITYGTSFWDTNPDIINRVLSKLNSFDSSWSMMSAATCRWTSSINGVDGHSHSYNHYNENLRAFIYAGSINIPDKQINELPPGLPNPLPEGFFEPYKIDYTNDNITLLVVSPITIYEF